MSYTLEQKREASNRNELWWRFPNETRASDMAWSLCSCGFSCSEAEYHIGPTPPRVLSELEVELLEALKEIVDSATDGTAAIRDPLVTKARAAIQKAEGQK